MPTALRLHYLARARLWSEVVLSGGDRVFVPTTEVLPPGTRVQVEIDAPELDEPLRAQGVVQQIRPLGPGQPAGVMVRLDPESLERCRAEVAEHDDAARVSGRSEDRADCELPARALAPVAMRGCAVKSLSAHGLTLRAPLPVAKGAQLRLAVLLPDGTEAQVQAVVRWSRPELSLAGLRLEQVEAATAQQLTGAVQALLAQRAQRDVSHLVLVADDDPSILDFTSRVVLKAGHRVVRAERGDTALELVRTERPRLVFLDVLMPGLDGLEVCQAIRADAALAKTPVVLLSAMSEERLAAAARSSGADGYLTKPMRLEVMRAVLSDRLPVAR